ncbi:MAG: hypothetical protein AABZ77_06650 [Chloroflexota bacterium]
MKSVVVLLVVFVLVTSTSCTGSGKLQEDLNAANSANTLLRSQAANNQAVMQSLQQQIDSAKSTIQSLQEQINSGNTVNATLLSLQAQLKTAQSQLVTANLTIVSLQDKAGTNQKLLQSLETQLITASSTINALDQQLNAAQKQLRDTTGVLNQRIDWLSKIALAPSSAIPVDCDYLYSLAKSNEVAVDFYYRYKLVQMSQLIVVDVTDTPGIVKLKSLGGTVFELTFLNTTGLEKLLPNMQITVYGTCKGLIAGSVITTAPSGNSTAPGGNSTAPSGNSTAPSGNLTAGVGARVPVWGPDFVLVSIDAW